MSDKLLGVTIDNQSRKNILENIKKSLSGHKEFVHVVSLNPENIVVAQESPEFKHVLNHAQIRLIDGVGVGWAATLLGIPHGRRFSGVDLMQELIGMADGLRLSVGLIGGNGDLAENLAKCYSQAYHEATFFGLEGFKNIKNPEKTEENRVKSIVADRRPHLVFVSFGSPDQEIWIWNNRELFKNTVCVGVGGAFDFLGGHVKRAPNLVRRMGFEWLFRLGIQPWRWKRQLRLIRFASLVAGEKIWKKKS